MGADDIGGTQNIKSTTDAVARNGEKYGDPSDDVIARAYRDDKRIGDIWCAKNVEKYLKRFLGKSRKSNNQTDLLKAKDYLDRMIMENEKLGTKEFEIIE